MTPTQGYFMASVTPGTSILWALSIIKMLIFYDYWNKENIIQDGFFMMFSFFF